MIFAKKTGNVVVIPMNIGTNQPIPISSYDEELPPDAFPVTMTHQEALAKFSRGGITFFEPPQPEQKVSPGVMADDKDYEEFLKENSIGCIPNDSVANLVVSPVPIKLKSFDITTKAPEFIDTKFIDDCMKRAIQNEMETYELALDFASTKKKKEIDIILGAFKKFLDRIENGSKK